MTAADTKIAELEAKLKAETVKSTQLQDLVEKKTKDVQSLTDKVKYFKSSEYTGKVVDIFQNLEEFQSVLFEKACSFYDRGAMHILRQFHQCIPDKKTHV